MNSPRLPIEIGEIRGLMIIVGNGQKSGRYRLRAESSNFRDWFDVGTWDTVEEAEEEFRVWDKIRKEQHEEAWRI